MKVSKHRFKRQESWRLKRVTEAWRRPRGVTSRMRKEKAGWPPKVKNGFGSAAATRGLHPRMLVDQRVERLSDLEGLDPKRHIIRISARLGERKRLLLLERVRQLNFHIANPGKQEARPAEAEAASETEAAPSPVDTGAGETLEEEAVAETSEKALSKTLEKATIETERNEETEETEEES